MPYTRDHSARLINFARQMRKEPSDAEKRMWSIVRGKKLGGFYFRRQVPIEGFIADFYCSTVQLVVEVDGRQHFTEEQRQYDERRSAVFAVLGIRVMRFPAWQVLKESDAIGKTIYRDCQELFAALPGEAMPDADPTFAVAERRRRRK